MPMLLSALGQTNGTTGWTGTYATDTALFLKMFAGEVLSTFETASVMLPLHTVRTISEGKSAQFPVTGIATAGYHVPGTSIIDGAMGTVYTAASSGGAVTNATSVPTGTYLNQIKHAERVINVDDQLISSAFIAKLDEARNHYDVRAIYSTEIGRALAKQMDRNLIALGVLAARATTTITGGKGGTAIDISAAATRAAVTGAELVAGIYEAARVLDENDVPAEDRVAILEPASYYKVIQSKDIINRDFSENNGSLAGGKVYEVAGIQIVKSNNAVSVFGQTVSGATGQQNTYSGNFSATIGLVMHKAAIGTVKLMDLKLETEYSVERQGTLMVAGYAVGHGILRPECAVELDIS